MGGAADWTAVEERGSIHDVLVDNVRILSGKNPSARFNSRQGGSIHDVTVKDAYSGTTKLDFSSIVGESADFSTGNSAAWAISLFPSFMLYCN